MYSIRRRSHQAPQRMGFLAGLRRATRRLSVQLVGGIGDGCVLLGQSDRNEGVTNWRSRRAAAYRQKGRTMDQLPPTMGPSPSRLLCAVLLVCKVGFIGVGVSPLLSQQVTGKLVQEYRFVVPDSLALTQVDRIAESPSGELYLICSRDGRMLVFDARGRLVRTIGRLGEGPGEFKFVDRVGWIGDSLWVTDLANRRISLFSADGRFRRSAVFPSISTRRPRMQFWPEALLADGSLLVWESWSPSDEAFSSAAGLLLLRTSKSGEVLDTLRRLTARHVAMVVRLPHGMLQRQQPWSDDDLYTLGADGGEIVVIERPIAESTSPTHFRMIAYRPDGRVIFQRQILYTPVPLTTKRFDVEVERNAKLILKGFSGISEARRAVAAQLFRPRFQPAANRILVGRDHSIWVNVSREANDSTWLVFDSRGIQVATILVPSRGKLLAVSLTGAWGVEMDLDDVPVPMHYRIEKP